MKGGHLRLCQDVCSYSRAIKQRHEGRPDLSPWDFWDLRPCKDRLRFYLDDEGKEAGQDFLKKRHVLSKGEIQTCCCNDGACVTTPRAISFDF
ncbi:hypothetical protein TNCV_2752151 [Trichonephila clavipes]|nr:hypothetical protein TNCV_2752151 [Trichonephila clavipes]